MHLSFLVYSFISHHPFCVSAVFFNTSISFKVSWYLSRCQSCVLAIILIDLIRHDHHPQQEYTPHKLECPSCCPTLAYILLSSYSPSSIFSQPDHLQILLCSNQANVAVLAPVLCSPSTYKLQFPLTLPVGPQSSIETTMSPTIHRMKRMKDPIMTIPGRSWRWEMSQSIMRMKRREREADVTQYGKYLWMRF